ncbi:acyltransferase family protein [Aurantibacillus circumpalustris]|uniref:acyltransferase family protein n=1 Tax=Aurantibacillus circumpalustris TaxID=3036359 RepID=UPI00295B2810|nr:acyltransferase [Aurantibacillus circumpalustris]
MKDSKVYFENLDGVRGLAFLAVFLYHVFGYMNYDAGNGIENFFIQNIFLVGNLGVNLFFVLSGFLITYLLLKEKEIKGKINIKHFYMRRVLRIWPLFYLVLIIGFFVYPFLIHKFNLNDVKEHLIYYVGFLNNFDRIQTEFVGVGNDSLGVLWSIAVEEQFYLFWPILLQLLPKKQIPILMFLIIAVSLFFRYYSLGNESVLYFSTFSVMSDLAIGGLSAWLILYHQAFVTHIENLSPLVIKSAYLIFILSFISFKYWMNFNEVTRTGERLFLSLFFSFIILEQCFSLNSFFKLKNFKRLSQLGLISYGLYCLHLFSISFVQKVNSIFCLTKLNGFQFYAELFVCLVLSIGICYLSYNYFEKKLLRYKTRYA